MSQLPRPHQPNPLDKPPEEQGKTAMFELDCKVAAGLCYLPVFLLNVILAGVWLGTEPRSNKFLRFHAYQSILLTMAFFVVSAILGILGKIFSLLPFLGFFSFIGNVVTFLFVAGWMLLSLYVGWYALQGDMAKLPYIGDFAEHNCM